MPRALRLSSFKRSNWRIVTRTGGVALNTDRQHHVIGFSVILVGLSQLSPTPWTTGSWRKECSATSARMFTRAYHCAALAIFGVVHRSVLLRTE